LAKAATDAAHLTQSGAILGTPAYMAPEQAGGQVPDPRSDLFSLGCVLYQACTGQQPFTGPDMIATLAATALHQPPAPREVRPEVPQVLSDLVMRLLAKQPEQRPESAQEVAAALAAIAENKRAAFTKGGGPQRPPWPAGAKKGAPPSRNPRRRALTGAAVLFVGLVVAGVVFSLKTRHGTLVVTVTEPDVQVVIDGEAKMVVDSKKVGRLELIPGDHELTVKRGEETLYTAAFTLERGGTRIIDAKWQASAKEGEAPSAVRHVDSPGDLRKEGPKAVQPPKEAKGSAQSPEPRDTRAMQLLLDADFKKSLHGFSLGDGERFTFSHENGEWQYLGKQDGYWYHDQPGLEDHQVLDFIFEAEARFAKPTSPTDNWNLTFGGAETGPRFKFGVGNDGRVGLWFRVGDEAERFRDESLLSFTRVPALRPVPEPNTFRLEVIGGTVRIFVNGGYVGEKTDGRLTASSLTLQLEIDKPPLDVRFRRIRLWRPEPGGVVSPTPVEKPAYEADFHHKVSAFPEGRTPVCHYVEGVYIVESEPGTAQRVGRYQPEGDYHAELTGRVKEGFGGGWGLACGTSARRGTWVEVRGDGHYRIRPLGAGKPRHLTGTPKDGWEYHKAIKPGGEFNTVGVAVRRRVLTLYINGQWVCDMADPAYVPGGLQVGVSADTEPAVAEFRKLQVWPLAPQGKTP
jgi:hypothetical protein